MRNELLSLWFVSVATTVGSETTLQAAFLDLISTTPGPNGNRFVGSMDGVSVIGSSGNAAGEYSFNPAGVATASSTLDSTSPQYSYASVYDPAAVSADRVGYSALFGGLSVPMTITFGVPVTNPRFHVADLDGVTYTFVLTGGLTGVSLVRGNGGDGDGLQVVGNVVSDVNPATISFIGPTDLPQTTGARSAYGTVSLNGTFTSLLINVTTVRGDGGSFTLSSVPEPTAMAVVGAGGLALRRRCRAAR